MALSPLPIKEYIIRFLSKHQNYQTFPLKQDTEELANGQQRLQKPSEDNKFWPQGIVARFKQEPLNDYETDIARKTFHFRGTNIEADGVTPIDPIHRVSVFDTDKAAEQEGWPPHIKEHVEQFLLRKQTGGDIILAEEPTPAPPWPNYDEFDDITEIMELVNNLGVDRTKAALYEKRNMNRKKLVALLEAGQPTEVVRA